MGYGFGFLSGSVDLVVFMASQLSICLPELRIGFDQENFDLIFIPKAQDLFGPGCRVLEGLDLELWNLVLEIELQI